jgi:hypothetical protein
MTHWAATPERGGSAAVVLFAPHYRRPPMSKSQNNHDSMQMTQNQNNEMSEDPRDGSRNADAKTTGGKEPSNQIPEEQSQNEGTIEAFGEQGAGIAAKE